MTAPPMTTTNSPTSTSTSTTALAAPTRMAPTRVVDDPGSLSDEQLLELFERNDKRALVIGAVSGAAAVALTALLTTMTPIGPWAMIPAFVAGFFGAVRLARKSNAAQEGVTDRCQARVIGAFQKEMLLREFTWRDAFDARGDRNRRMLSGVRARLQRDAEAIDVAEGVTEAGTPNTRDR